jgi:hypothetical protein
MIADNTVFRTRIPTADSAMITVSWLKVISSRPSEVKIESAQEGKLGDFVAEVVIESMPVTATAATSPIRAIPTRSRSPRETWTPAAKKRRRRFWGGNSETALEMAWRIF